MYWCLECKLDFDCRSCTGSLICNISCPISIDSSTSLLPILWPLPSLVEVVQVPSLTFTHVQVVQRCKCSSGWTGIDCSTPSTGYAVWEKMGWDSGTSPPARVGHLMLTEESSGSLLVFGGYSFELGYLNDVWRFNVSLSTWTKLETRMGQQGQIRGRYLHAGFIYQVRFYKGKNSHCVKYSKMWANVGFVFDEICDIFLSFRTSLRCTVESLRMASVVRFGLWIFWITILGQK